MDTAMLEQTFMESTNQPMFWVKHGSALFTSLAGHLPHDFNLLTTGWVLSVLHDGTDKVTLETKAKIREVIRFFPGYDRQMSEQGYYALEFNKSMELACSAVRYGRARGLFK